MRPGSRTRSVSRNSERCGWSAKRLRVRLGQTIPSLTLMDRPVESTAPASPTAPNDATTAIVERRASAVNRRRLSVRSILRGAFSPRRRAGRRTSDQDTPIDWHHPHLMFLSLVMLTLSVADAFSTVTLLNSGAEEANPLLALFVASHGGVAATARAERVQTSRRRRRTAPPHTTVLVERFIRSQRQRHAGHVARSLRCRT